MDHHNLLNNSHLLNKGESDQMYKDAFELLMLKDELIRDLQSQLESERIENINLRKNCKELEQKMILIDENLDFNESSGGLNIKHAMGMTPSQYMNKSLNLNHTPGNNMNFNFLTSNENLDVMKLLDEKSDLKQKLESAKQELNIYIEKAKNLSDIEEIYKSQVESLKKKVDYFEKFSQQAKEREKYIEELIDRYNTLEKDYENILTSKEIEIKELMAQISVQNDNESRLRNQLDILNQNSNSYTQELIKEIRQIDEKNKELEMNLYKAEIVYKEEIKKLQRLISQNENNADKNSANNNQNPPSSKGPGFNSSLKVEDLASSLTKSIRERIDSQNKKISSQNVEILSLQYEVEKLTSELSYEKELNDKLQKNLAEHKFKLMNKTTNNVCMEEAQVQTVLKIEDIDSVKYKTKILEENLSKISESYEKCSKIIKNLQDENSKLVKDIREKEDEIQILYKKFDKINKNEKFSLDRELLNSIGNSAKLNMTISALKMREAELVERINSLENNYGQISGNNNPNPQRVNNLKNSQATQQEKNLTSTQNMQSVSFNISDDSNLNNLNHNMNVGIRPNIQQNNYMSTPKDILNEKYELELKSLQEDNYFLREQNFKFMSDMNRLSENLNNYKNQYENLRVEKEEIIRDKNDSSMRYENIIRDLKSELDKSKILNNDSLEEMRNKLNLLTEMNNKMNEQFTSLQNKFYVQSGLINEKNLEIKNLTKKCDNLERENENLIEENNSQIEKIKNFENEIIPSLKKENEKLKRENLDINNKYSSEIERLNFNVNEYSERFKIVESENQNLKEINNKLKNKLNDMYEEGKEKENKLVNLLKEENRDMENRMRAQINELRAENDNLVKERSMLRLNNNELKFELNSLKEQMTQNNNQFNPSSNSGLNMRKNRNLINSFMSSNNHHAQSANNSFDMGQVNLNLSQSKKINETSNSNSKLNSQIRELREANKQLQLKIDDLSEILESTEMNLKTLKFDFSNLEREKVIVLEKLQNKENELKSLKSENYMLNENLKKFSNSSDLENLLQEMTTKNQTINYLIDEVEKVKKENRDKILDLENVSLRYKEENQHLNENLQFIKEDLEKFKEEHVSMIKDMKKENEILINDIEEKEREIETLMRDKIKLEHGFEEKFKNNEEYNEKIVQELKLNSEENSSLKNELENVTKGSLEKFNTLSEKFTKSKLKIDSLINVYEAHLKFLKERFNYYLNDFGTIVASKSNVKDFSEKIIKMIKNIESGVENLSKLSEREACIENLRGELKVMKSKEIINLDKIKKLTKENEEMCELVNLKKLQGKLKKSNNNSSLNSTNINSPPQMGFNDTINLLNLESLTKELSEIKLNENKMKVKLQTANAELKYLREHNLFLKETQESLNTKIKTLEEDLTKSQKEHVDLNKSHKSEILKIMEELKRIKEKWISPDKLSEYLTQIEELEKQNKSYKDDINRKRELITTLKNQNTGLNSILKESNINQNNKDSTFMNPFNNNLNKESASLEEKIKSLNKELTRKDTIIKELRSNVENFKINEKKLQEENSTLIEKTKIHKIDISRKESLLKEYKEKLNQTGLLDNSVSGGGNNINVNSNLSKLNQTQEEVKELKESIKKLKSEIDRKDGMIKTLKAKLETVNLEIEQLRNLNLKLSKNNSNEIEKEQKNQEMIRAKLDSLSSQNENLLSVMRRIFKELISTYERLRARTKVLNSNKITQQSNLFSTSSKLKEGLDILGVTQDELEEYISPNYNTSEKFEIYDRVNSLLDSEKVEAETLMNLYNMLKEKISMIEKNIVLNDDTFKKYI
jgi:chromosome segregation ATPase